MDFRRLRTVLKTRVMAGAFWSDVVVGLGLLWIGHGCAVHSPASKHAEETQSLRQSRAALPTPLTTSRNAPLFLPSHSVTLSLPERELWQVNEVGSYFRAFHAETAGELWVKRWSEGERVSALTCTRQSQLWRPSLAAPSTPATRRLERSIAVDYHTEILLHQWADADVWRGQLTANGGAIRDCLTYVYFTHAPNSPLGRAIVAQRLEVMLEVLEDLRTESTASKLP